MKSLVFTSLVTILSQNLRAQQFSVPLSICDSIASNQFHYVIDGYGVFTDSMEVHAELLNPSNNSVIFAGQHSMSGAFQSTLNNFAFDPSSGACHFDLGIYTTDDRVLHMWLIINGNKQQEIYYQE